MSTKHTPSWRIHSAPTVGPDRYIIDEPDGTSVALVWGKDRAALIAAAPGMLELLKTLHELGGLGYEKHRRIESLINKATQP